MGDLITAAESGFASTTGFTMSAAVDWTGTNLTKLFIGSGLALLYNLRYWIIVLVALPLIVYFAYRAFRFFRA